MRLRLSAIAFALLSVSIAHAQDAGDPAAGAKVFMQCRICHQIGPNAKNMVGPVLNGLFGRHCGSVPGYAYSDANKNSGITWNETVFRDYIHDPQKRIPHTKMTFAGVKDDHKVDDLIAYLKQFDAQGNKK